MNIADVEMMRLSGQPLEKCYDELLKVAYSLQKRLVKKDEPDVPDPREEQLYQMFPRKVAKPAALKAIRRALKQTTFENLSNKIRLYASRCRADGTEERYICHPATWFNQGRWMDAEERAGQSEIEQLKFDIANSRAFGGGKRWSDSATQAEREKLRQDINALLEIDPNFKLATLRS